MCLVPSGTPDVCSVSQLHWKPPDSCSDQTPRMALLDDAPEAAGLPEPLAAITEALKILKTQAPTDM